ncbi:hypothetical protein LCGC14_1853630, partial [marine sediment metagenome]
SWRGAAGLEGAVVTNKFLTKGSFFMDFAMRATYSIFGLSVLYGGAWSVDSVATRGQE